MNDSFKKTNLNLNFIKSIVFLNTNLFIKNNLYCVTYEVL